ncbi:MAG: DJ-1/PfpI family protein, partial [Syntrophothermus sp.]
MEIRKKRIAFFIEKLYEDLEFWYPYLRLKEEGCDTVVIGPTVGEYIGKNGLKASAEQSIVAVKPDEFSALVIPGGYSPDHMRRIPEMVDFVRTMHEQNKIIAAICHGPWMLASAGILNGV